MLHIPFFHHGMAQSQVGDGGDGLQLWMAAMNILNKTAVIVKLNGMLHVRPCFEHRRILWRDVSILF
jgi:hypothetical protein